MSTIAAMVHSKILPIVDVGSLFEAPESEVVHHKGKSQAASDLLLAFETTGLAYLRFDGASQGLLEKHVVPAFATAQRFFELSANQKLSATGRMLPKGVTRGYLGVGAESGAKMFEQKEAFSWSYDWSQALRRPENGLEAMNVWPTLTESDGKEDGEMRKSFNKLFSFMCDVMLTLVDAISQVYSSDILPDLRELCMQGQSISLLRAFHYLATDNARNDMTGSCEHTDWGFATLIAQQDNGGAALQVFLDNEWVDVPPIPTTLVVNCSDFLSMLTNGRLKSPLHRVVLTQKERISFVFFQYPGFNTPVPKLSEQGILRTASLSLLKNQRASASGEDECFDLNKLENMSFGEFIALKWDQVSRT